MENMIVSTVTSPCCKLEVVGVEWYSSIMNEYLVNNQ